MALLPGWPHYKDIVITGQAGSGTDYQVELEIGDSAGGDFHLEGNCTNFPQDIEVTDDDGTTLLDFWIEDIAADPIIMRVKVDDDLGSNQTIRVYYGKNGATTNSDIGATFLFGDDFSGTLSDKWNIFGTASNSGGICTITGAAAWNSDGIASKTTFDRTSQGYVIRSRFRNNKVIQSDHMFGYSNQGALSFASGFQLYHGNDNTHVWEGGNVHEFGYENNWGVYGIHEIYAKVLNDYTIITETAASHDNASTENNKAVTFNKFNDTTNIDWVLVRKYNDPEPAFASAGAEQNAPTATVPIFMQQHNQFSGGQLT